MKIELELKEAGQLPERDGMIVVFVKYEPTYKYAVFTEKVRKGEKVTFLTHKVVGWAYLPDDVEIERMLNGIGFNQEWINFLSENAKTK